MRKSLTSMLNDLGNYLRKVDDRYAEGVQDIILGSNPNPGTTRGIAASLLGSPVRFDGDIGTDPRMIDRVAKYAVPVTSATVRYVLPAAGLTVAGQALGDLVNSLYEKDDER